MQVASPVPNHAGVIDADGHLIHHCHGRLSSRDVYGGYWRHVTTHVLRHRSLIGEGAPC
jgi:cell wall-associated NlpC family hydrolase